MHKSKSFVFYYLLKSTILPFALVQEINKKILSLDYTSFRVEILSADAQPSYKDGVIVVVTGCLTGSDNLKRKFTQSFFLAPQDKGYFVLNDVFRYVDEYKLVVKKWLSSYFYTW